MSRRVNAGRRGHWRPLLKRGEASPLNTVAHLCRPSARRRPESELSVWTRERAGRVLTSTPRICHRGPFRSMRSHRRRLTSPLIQVPFASAGGSLEEKWAQGLTALCPSVVSSRISH